jgi:hypothetical protein
MRTRLIFLLIFAAAVYGMVYVGQQVAHRAAQRAEEASVATAPGEAAGPNGTETESVIPPDPAEAELPEEGESGSRASLVEPEPVEATPEVVAATGVTKPEPVPVARTGTAIEGYVFSEGRPVAGARVCWRPSRDSAYVPPSWTAPPLDEEAIQHGAQADFTTENPLNPGDSSPVRLGGGYQRYDTAVARSFPTVPGKEYEVTVDSRYVHSTWLGGVHGEGDRLSLQIGQFGVDLTGQTTDHESPGIQYQSVTDGPNDCWQRFRMQFTARKEKTSVWLHAKQLESQVGLVWFDRLTVRDLSEEKETALLGKTSKKQEDERDDYVGSVVTGMHGHYRIDGIGPGEYDLCAAYPGKGSAQKERVRVGKGETASASFNLLGGGVIRGKVLENLVGDPIPGAIVTAKLPVKSRERINADNIPEVHATRTGNSGQFYLHGLLPGVSYHVTVEAPDYVPPRMQTVIPDGPETVFALSPEGGVYGLVLEEGTERPVEGAVVRVFQPLGPSLFGISEPSGTEKEPVFEPGERMAAASTNVEGQFRVSGLEKGVYRLIAEKNGRKSTQVSGDAAIIRVDSRVAQAVVSLHLPRGGRLRGRAVDVKTKQPVGGVDLIMTMIAQQPKQPSDIIESLGGLIIHNLTRRAGATSVDVETDPSDEAPDLGAMAIQAPEEHFFSPRFCVRTEEDGIFQVDDIGIGSWRMGLRTEDYRFARGAPSFMVDGQSQIDLEVLLSEAPAIEGVVVDETGLGVEGVRVWPRMSNPRNGRSYVTLFEELGMAHSGADGVFRIRGVHPQTAYDLVATARDGRMGLLEGVQAEQKNVEIVLEPFGSIQGEIRFESGKPLVGAKVTALGGDLCGGHWWRDGRTDGEGRFRVQHLVTGCYDLDFGTRWPELHARYGPVRVEQGEEITDLELVIPGQGKITGTVRFGDGSGAPGVVVTAIKLDEEGQPKRPRHWMRIEPNPLDDDREPELQFDILVHEGSTDEVGDYVIEDLLPGSYQVVAQFPEHLAPHERMDVVRSQTVQLGEDPLTGVDFVMVQAIEYDPATGTTSSTGIVHVGP